MTEEERRERWRRVAEIVEEFARASGADGQKRWEERVRALSPRYLKRRRLSRGEVLAQGPSGDELLRWREGDIDKDVEVSLESDGRLEVSAQAGEVSGQEGLPVPGGAWCRWRVGELAGDAAETRAKIPRFARNDRASLGMISGRYRHPEPSEGSWPQQRPGWG
jgi:hypothetical protein